MIANLSGIARDLRYAARALGRTPAFTVGAVATIALTVGATTAIFSVVYGVLLRQLPYRHPERVFWIWSDQPGRDRAPFNVPDFIDYRDSTKTLSGFAGFATFSANLSDETTTERVQGIRATGNLFGVLGAQAHIGRLLEPADEQPGAPGVVILAESFWMRRFGADRSLVGREIRLNGEMYTVAGVVAAGFSVPVRDVEIVVPFAPDQDPRRGVRNSVNFINGVGRLADHVSLTQAAGELTGIAQRLQAQFPVENARKRGVRMVSVMDGIVGPFRAALWTLFAAVGAVLLIACANLANLMLTRATGRRRELAVQLALGSSRAHVVQQVLAEAWLIASSGGVLGVALAWGGVAALVALAPTELPRSADIRLDRLVLLFSLVVSAVTALLFGVIPALASAGVDMRDALREGGRGATGAGRRLRGLLVSSEVALAVLLLIVMTLLAKSFANVLAVELGFDSTRVLSARLTLPAKRFDSRDALITFQRSLAEHLSSLPGVTHSGAISSLPLSGVIARVPFTVAARPVDRQHVPMAQYRMISAGYFEAARIPVLRGRSFSERDTDRSQAVAVVNAQLAGQWLNGLEPIGARLLVNDNDSAPRPVEIVGVVGNVRQTTLDGDPTWDLYLPYPQLHSDNVGLASANMFWIVRTSGEPMNLAASLVAQVRRVDPDVAAGQIRPLGRYVSDALAPRRFSLWLMAAFAITALVLALTGIYAVVMYSVSQRAREIGIRMALGASRWGIVRLVTGQGMRFVFIGVGVGLVIAVALTRLLSSMLFGVSATDPAILGQIAAAVAAGSAPACALPAARIAGRVLARLPGNI
jgi:putative ABC transport system permease protein